MIKPQPTLPAPSADIAIALVLLVLPWIISDSTFLELLRWAAIIYLIGAALIYKFFAVKRQQ